MPRSPHHLLNAPSLWKALGNASRIGTYVGVDAENDGGAKEKEQVQKGLEKALKAALDDAHVVGCSRVSREMRNS